MERIVRARVQILVMLMTIVAVGGPTWAESGDAGATEVAARWSVAEQLIEAGVEPEIAFGQAMQLTAGDIRVLVANPAMLQRAAGSNSQLVFLVILIALFVAAIAAGASGGISIG